MVNRKPAAKVAQEPILHYHDHPVIGRSCEAWNLAYLKAEARGSCVVSCRLRGNEAYRAAIPPLSDPACIPDFIACVAFGLGMGFICDPAGARLLQAAQIATTAHKALSKLKKINPKNTDKPQKNKGLNSKNEKNTPLEVEINNVIN